jgi:hypothetical protein
MMIMMLLLLTAVAGFFPSYPATAPHVTAVGATQGPESGGFSAPVADV